MLDEIEAARTSRSTCRHCKEKIKEGVLRFGLNNRPPWDDPVFKWYHLDCAAESYPYRLWRSFWNTGTQVPTEVLESILKHSKDKEPPALPYAAVADSELDCTICGTAILKGDFLVMIDEGGGKKRLSNQRQPLAIFDGSEFFHYKNMPPLETVRVHPACIKKVEGRWWTKHPEALASLIQSRSAQLTRLQFVELGKQVMGE